MLDQQIVPEEIDVLLEGMLDSLHQDVLEIVLDPRAVVPDKVLLVFY